MSEIPGDRNIRADLHTHGAIGFQDYWLGWQGYRGQNLLQRYIDACIKRDITVCGVISENYKIEKGSPEDRIGHLMGFIPKMPRGYEIKMLGENVIHAKKDGNDVYLLNGQTVITMQDGKRLRHLVLGSNQVPNECSLEGTIDYCNGLGLPNGFEGIEVSGHFGVDRKLAEKLADKVWFVQGHDQQMIIPDFLTWFPKLGKYPRAANHAARAFAREHGLHWFPVSNAHRFGSIGQSYAAIPESALNFSSEEKLIESLGGALRNGYFFGVRSYENPVTWAAWSGAFQLGKLIAEKRGIEPR